MSQDKRPVNLDLTKFAFPTPAYASILHRVSGAFMFVGVAGLLFALDMSLSSAESFDRLVSGLQAPLFKVLAFVLLTTLAYHLVAGIKHLLQDLGIGETLQGGLLAARLTLAAGVLFAVLIAVWLTLS